MIITQIVNPMQTEEHIIFSDEITRSAQVYADIKRKLNLFNFCVTDGLIYDVASARIYPSIIPSIAFDFYILIDLSDRVSYDEALALKQCLEYKHNITSVKIEQKNKPIVEYLPS